MTAAPFDTLKLTKAHREKAHFTQEQAEGLTESPSDSFEEQIATKQDIVELRSELKGEIATLKHGIEQLDARFTAKFDQLEAKFEPLELRLTIKLGTIVAAIVTVAMLIIKVAHL